ncbi:MAG: SDR family oxidoreductase [Myxococcales bacterium]|nr:SDR family oxidoreductase [Myxococcales bacterium]MCB9625878.1 SDR family oxidoreductase [Sandaracinaceae bacterium]
MKISSGRVLVTGASRGIGRAVVAQLVARGARVAAVGRDEEALMQVARTSSRQVTAVVGDLARESERELLVGHAAEALGGLDGLIHCAGVVKYEPVGTLTPQALEAMWRVNQLAPTLLSQEAARIMVEQGHGGSIVTVSSTLSTRPAPSTVGYAGTKAALEATTRGLAKELSARAIRVNAVAPGVVDTDMVRQPRVAPGTRAPEGAERERLVAEQLEALAYLHPLGRLGTAEEVAELIVQVLDAEWMTGSVVTLDGGLSL